METLAGQDGQRQLPPMAEQKIAIAAAVATLVQDGQTVILDGGTTCYQVAAALQGRHISVVTNSVSIAERLSGEIATEVTIVGGLLYPRVGVALGDTAVRQLAGIRASLLILSCSGIEPDGVFNTNQMMVDVERRMMASADQVILVADSSKFTKRGLARLCALSELDALVTDAGLTAEAQATLAGAGVRVVIAGAETKVGL
jgi:DeoR/GlpR family transcriptional regulator of sugar metabolism